MTEFFAVLTPLLVLTTAIRVVTSSAWWVRVFDFPRLQILVLAFIEREAPDIVIALETDAWWETQLDCLQTTYPHTLLQLPCGRRLNLEHVA